jgi:anti-anti-sigma factor
MAHRQAPGSQGASAFDSPEAPSVDIEIIRTRTLAIVHCRGRFVFTDGAALLRERVGQALSAGLDVVLDLPAVTQIDAHGAGVLAELSGRARGEGRSLVIARVSERVRRVLRVTGLDGVIPGVADRRVLAAAAREIKAAAETGFSAAFAPQDIDPAVCFSR